MPTLLFVYGTLKRGQCNEHRLAGQTFVGPARTAPKYRLYQVDWHPALVPDADGVAVEGEIWEVDGATLRHLDGFEGVPEWFDRRGVEIDGVDGQVEAYFYQGNISGLRDCGGRWPIMLATDGCG